MYNRYHEYQQKIKEAESEAARLAKFEEKKATGEAEKRKAEAAKLQKEAEDAKVAKQKKAEAAREAKAAEKKRQKQEAEAAAAAVAARAASERAVETAQTLAKNMHHQTNFGMNAPQEVQHGEGEDYYGGAGW